jgi:hypothetical protein
MDQIQRGASVRDLVNVLLILAGVITLLLLPADGEPW